MILDIDKKPMEDNLPRGAKGRPMICEQTGRYEPSMASMAISMRISYPLMAKFMAGKCKHAKGYTFRYATSEEIAEASK